MTVHSPDPATRRRALRRRHLLQRQTIIFGTLIVALIVLALAALAVYSGQIPPPFDEEWYDANPEDSVVETTPCPAPDATPVSWGAITANVYNGTEIGGLAAQTGESLEGLGVVIGTEANYPQGSYAGATRLVTGTAGIDDAYTLALVLPEAEIVYDATKQDAVVDVVLGAEFGGVGDGDAVDGSQPLVGLEGCTAFADLGVSTAGA
ncbi:LytR C-terminal domain-containing protein [Serinibacter salmoneus]|uniref:LytR cell envelope-related transcriptional attenuator n=1 Tax=Serinibacter salmoneus TaxID=556530 RepID=A0A2A9D275_9MICO|nr:LytR C-terminal domain-containing protein [Serinibacter salmoneus]PFG20774.1 LytR cell envelope-related transcriptional attenuator [Serinibacter salmoneus]